MKKCLNCGSIYLERVYPIPSSWEFSAEDYEAYGCTDCGHIEFFVCQSTMNRIQKIRENRVKIDLEIKANSEIINKLKDELIPLQKQQKEVELKIKNLEFSAKNEEITVKKQKELLSQLEALKKQSTSYLKALSDVEGKIKQIKEKIDHLENQKRELR